jgi:hypothetical protein
LLDQPAWAGSYTVENVGGLLAAYAVFNPHAGLTLEDARGPRAYRCTDPTWRKWLPSAPTSPHWYTVEKLHDLIAAYLTKERETRRTRTVREFVSEFAGLSGTAKQKAVCEAAGLARAQLADLVSGENVDLVKVGRLLTAMQAESRPIKPDTLGRIGEEHLTHRLAASGCCRPESIRYKCVRDVDDDGLPFVIETAFGVLSEEYEDYGRSILVGVNWSPSLMLPFRTMPDTLQEARVDGRDPVIVLAHLARPGAQFIDRGKGVLTDAPKVIGNHLDNVTFGSGVVSGVGLALAAAAARAGAVDEVLDDQSRGALSGKVRQRHGRAKHRPDVGDREGR